MPAEQEGCEVRPHHLNLQSNLNRVMASHLDIVRPCTLGCTRLGRMNFGSCTPPHYLIGVTCPLRALEERERGRPDRGEGMAQSQFAHSAHSRAYSMRVDTSYCPPRRRRAPYPLGYQPS